MRQSNVDPLFWSGKKVFLTGHTGFKGGWLCLWLKTMGAKVVGYALQPDSKPNIFHALGVDNMLEQSYFADIRDLVSLKNAIEDAQPDIVFHMAAQPLVRYSYLHPIETYTTNVMGTANILEGTRRVDSIRATVIITTDKCYENKEWEWGYRENEAMGGSDPYSSSKACAELITSAYRQSFFSDAGSSNQIASARAGNVIGGGDWSIDRLIPDAIRAFEVGGKVKIRNPQSTRPWQHVLEPLSGYLVLAQQLYVEGAFYASSWNFGPSEKDNRSVQEVLELLIAKWGGHAAWEKEGIKQPHEAKLLNLDCSKARNILGWTPKWNLETAISKIVEWHKVFGVKGNIHDVSVLQISQYMES